MNLEEEAHHRKQRDDALNEINQRLEYQIKQLKDAAYEARTEIWDKWRKERFVARHSDDD